MSIDTGSYSYNISANADNTAYLWSGHGLTDVENPTLYFRDGDIVTLSKIGGGHPLKITNDADQTFVLESGGVLLLEPIEEGTYTYVCTSHAAMTGKILVGARYQGEGPDEGFGTGLLPTRNSPISVNQIRTKINEIITKGGVGGGKVTVSESPPDFPSEGNLWYDSSFAALFAYLEDYGWVQTNGAMGRAQSVIVDASAPSGVQENDFWFDTVNNVLKIYISGAWYAAAQTTQTSSSGGGDSGVSVNVSESSPTNPWDGDLWFHPDSEILSVFIGSSGLWIPVGSRVLVTNLTPTSSNSGDFWLNTDTNVLSVNNGTSWITINRTQAPIYGSSSRPTDALNGDLFFNTDTSLVEVYSNGQWVSSGVSSSVFSELNSELNDLSQSIDSIGGGASVTTSETAPTSPADGDLWFNESVGSLFVYIDGTGWVESSPGGESSGGGASVTTGETAPTSPTNGDLWYDTTVSELYVYIDGTGWVESNPGGGGGASEIINIAGTTDGGSPNRYVTDDPIPEGEWLVNINSGDSVEILHSDTYVVPAGHFLHFITTGSISDPLAYAITTSASPPEGTQSAYGWISASVDKMQSGTYDVAPIAGFALKLSGGSGESSSGGGASVTTGETAPTSPANGDLWYDTSVAKLYVYIDGTGWIQTNGGGSSSGGDSVDFHSGTFHGEDANAVDHEIVIPVDSSGKCGGVLELSDYATSTDQDEGGMMSWNFDASTGQIRMQQSWSGGESAYNKSSSVSATLTSTYQTIDISTSYQLYSWEAKYAGGNLYLTNNSHHGVWQATTSIPGSGGSGGGSSGGGASVTTGETAPTNPTDGDLWYDTSVAKLYVYIDGTGWVESSPGGESSSVAEVFTIDFGDSTGGSWFRTVLDDFNEATDKIYFLGWTGERSWQVSGDSRGRKSNLELPVTESENTYGLAIVLDSSVTINMSLQSNGSLYASASNSLVYGTSVSFLKVRSSAASGGGGGSQFVSIPRTYLSHLPNQDTTFNATDYGVPAGATHIQGYALVSGTATITVNAGTEYNGDNAFIIIKGGTGVGVALIPLDENGNFHVRVTDKPTTATVIGFSILGYMGSSSGGGGTGGSGTVEVLLDNVEFGARIDSSHGYYFTHSSSAPEIFDASVLSANQPVRIDIDVKLNGLDYYTDPVTERDVHIYWVKMKSPTSNTDTYKQGQHYRACWQQHVTLQRVGHTPAAYETPYRLHKEFGSIDSFGPVAMFDETKYNHQDPDTQLVYRIGSDGKFYAFIPRASDTFLNSFGDGTSDSGKIYYTMSARLTYL